ncbi:MAG TPA: recombinase family protein [Candidatus Competibacter sp.]|nr:recombinase family protein [Candidatus Competibacter sp.]
MADEKTAVIYCRVSTAKQADDEVPITGQRERCEDKARSLGAVVLRVYSDEGLSGRTDSRPAFQSAILFCEAHSPSYLITWSTSRFARNRFDAQLYKRRLAKAGTDLVYVSMDIDRNSAAGQLTEGMLELFDDFVSRQIAADTLRSMMRNARSGYWCGGRVPYGYRAVPAVDDPRRKRLEPNRDEFSIVRRAYELRAAGHGARFIAASLNGEGLFNRRRKWNISTILSLLQNDAVIGKMVFGRIQRIDGHRTVMPREDWIVVDAHEPIIDQSLWETVQSMIARDAPLRTDKPGAMYLGSPHSTHVFTGLLRCGRCGASMQIESAKGRSRRYSYYNCRSAQRSASCPTRRIPARELDSWLLDIICGDVLTRENLMTLAQDLRDMAARWHDDRASRRRAVEGQIRDVTRRNRKLYEVLEEFGRNAPNLGDIAFRLRENNDRLKTLQGELSRIDAEEPPHVEIGEQDLDELAALLAETVKSEHNAAKTRAFLAGFIERIVVDADVIKIEYAPASLFTDVFHSETKWRPEQELNL